MVAPTQADYGRLKQNLDSFDILINGSETEDVNTPSGAVYPTERKHQKILSDKVNLQIATLPTGHKGYATLAAAQAAQASLPANTLVEVTNDTTTANNGVYLWNGTTLTKSSYDPKIDATNKANAAKLDAINTAASYTDEKINKINLVTPVLTGQQIYDKARQNPTLLFSAIWSEYNKPVWHVGAHKFFDAVGSQVKVVKEELVMTIVATQVNQKFYFSTNSPADYAERFDVDWGDGTTTKSLRSQGAHVYTCAVGDTFTVKVTGKPYGIFYPEPAIVANCGEMIKSIDKNTLPKIMGTIVLQGLFNLETVCDGAFSSYNGSTLNLNLVKNCPKLNYNANMFLGLSQVTNIDNLFADTYQSVTKTIPAGLLNHFTNVTSAENLFYKITTQVPSGILDNMPKLENVTRAFFGSKSPTLDDRLFKNQTQLKKVTSCFSTSTSVADAGLIYTDILRGAPTATNYCFYETINMTNKTIIPAGWK